MESSTRSGGPCKLMLTPIACPPNFLVAPLLQRAVDEEHLDLDLDLDESEDEVHSLSIVPLCDLEGASGFSLLSLSTPTPILDIPCTSLPAQPAKRPFQAAFDDDDDPTNTDSSQSSPLKRSAHADSAGVPTATCSSASAQIGAQAHEASTTPAHSGPSRQTQRSKTRKAAQKSKKKDKNFQANTNAPRQKHIEKHLHAASAVPTSLNPTTLPVTSTAYQALPKGSGSKSSKIRTFEELKKAQYGVRKWDGRKTLILTESSGARKVVIVCVGKPSDPTWDVSVARVCTLLGTLSKTAHFNRSELYHKRGGFPAINAGIVYGLGSLQPHNLRNAGHEETLEKILSDPDIQRMAAHQSASLKTFVPRVYDHYHACLSGIVQHNQDLVVNFRRSVFASAAFNFGPQVVTRRHRDCMNCPYGFCAIHAMGDYDYTKGGHLVIDELKLMIEFPPGCLILLPSAVLTHSNTPVQDGEVRLSFTQYTTGALFTSPFTESFCIPPFRVTLNTAGTFRPISLPPSLAL